MKFIMEITVPADSLDTYQTVIYAGKRTLDDLYPSEMKVGASGTCGYASWRVEETPVEFPTEDGLYDIFTQGNCESSTLFLRLSDAFGPVWRRIVDTVPYNIMRENELEDKYGKLVSWKKI